MASDLDAFIAKTHASLHELSDKAKAARRLIGHPIRRDEGACRHCSALKHLSDCINDHLTQIDEARAGDTQDAPREPVKVPPPARCCGVCGRTRYRGFRGAVCCLVCDGRQFGSEWISLHLEAQE